MVRVVVVTSAVASARATKTNVSACLFVLQEFDDTTDSKCDTTATEYWADVDAADEVLAEQATPEDGEEEDVAWLKEWAAREVTEKKSELADKER